MKLHLVGGFLGSGKTTAIASAAKQLMDRGQIVGVVTNDQGRYLVDSAFFESQMMPVTAVTGGCFCCNYDKLTDQLDEMLEKYQPDVIFAESVGSCADIVATVINPLVELAQDAMKPASFSLFTDSRLLYQRLSGGDMPFSEDVVYIFDEQIEEANFLIINKRDLLTRAQTAELLQLAHARYPHKEIRLQDSYEASNITAWLALIDSEEMLLPRQAVDIDYDRYAKGENQLVWLNEEITLSHIQEGLSRRVVIDFIRNIIEPLYDEGKGNCHIKFMITSRQTAYKLSFVSVQDIKWFEAIPDFEDNRLHILLNVRLENDIARLTNYIDLALIRLVNHFGVIYQKEKFEGFYPAYPTPQHRIPKLE